MHAFLIISQDSGTTEQKVNEILSTNNTISHPLEISKIEDVRSLQKFTRLKLLKKTAIVINNFQNASEPAQNAFLKNLEEPQPNLIYILTATNKNLVLPTILSRCQVISTNSPKKISKKDVEFAQKFLDSNKIEKLTEVSKLKNRDDSKEFLTNLILGSHKLIKKNPQIALKLEVIGETLTRIQKNANPSLQLLNMCIFLSDN